MSTLLVSISDLASALRATIGETQQLVLGPATLGEQLPTSLLLQVLGMDSIPIAAPIVTESEGSLSVRGSVTLFGVSALDTSLTVTPTDTGVTLSVRTATDPQKTMPLGGVAALTLSRVAVEVDVSLAAGRRVISGMLSGTVQLGDIAIPISCPLPPRGGGLRITGQIDEANRPGLSALTQFVADLDIVAALPASLGDGLKLASFELGLGPQPSAAFLLTCATLEILPGALALNDVQVSITTRRGTGPGGSGFTLRIGATAQLGTVAFPLQLTKASGGAGWSLSIPMGYVALPSISDLAGLLGDGQAFDSLFPGLGGIGALGLSDLQIDTDASFRRISSISWGLAAMAPWTLPWLPDVSLQQASVDLVIADPLSASRAVTGQVRATLVLFGFEFTITGDKPSPGVGWNLVGRTADGAVLNLSAIAASFAGGPPPTGVPEFSFTDLMIALQPASGALAFSGRSAAPWRLPIGPADLVVSDVRFAVQRVQVGAVTQTTTALSGTIAIAGITASLALALPGRLLLTAQLPSIRLSDLVTSLCGEDLLAGLGLPAAMSDFTLTSGALQIDPTAGTVQLSGQIPTVGEFELSVRKGGGSRWGIVLGIVARSGFSLGDTLQVPELAQLQLSDLSLVLATQSDPHFVFQRAGALPGVSRGLTFTANLSLGNLGLRDTLGIDLQTAAVRGTIGPSPADLKLSAALRMSVPLGNGVTLRDPTLLVQVVPAVVGLTGTLDAAIDGSALAFSGGFLIASAPPSATLSARMVGDWKNPCGVGGLTISDLSLDWTLPSGLPSMAGTVRFGGNLVSVAIYMNVQAPVIQAHLQMLDLRSLASDTGATSGGLPPGLQKTLSDICLEEIDLSLVPRATDFRGTHYEQGLRLSVGRMRCFGVTGAGTIHSSTATGLVLHAQVDAFAVSPQLKIDGCQLDLTLKSGTTPALVLTGRATLLDIESDVAVALSDAGFRFAIHGTLFRGLSARLEVSGGHFPSGQDIAVQAQVDLDWLGQFSAAAVSTVQGWGEQAAAQIVAAQQLLAQKQRDAGAYAQKIRSMREAILHQREIDQARLSDAQRDVAMAQAKVDALQAEIRAMLDKIAAERAHDQRKLDGARAAVAGAQASVNSINQEIDATNSWFYGLPKVDFPWNASQAREGAWFAGKMAGLYGARDVATGVLDAAARTVSLIQQGIAAFPAELDPRVVALTTVKATADTALGGANATLASARAAIKLYPVEADPALVAMTAASEAASLGLVAAQEALSQVQASLGPITSFVAGAVSTALSIREARFSASLAGLVSSSVLLQVTMTSGAQYKVDIDLHHALAAAAKLAGQVLGTDAPSAIHAAEIRVATAAQAEVLAQSAALPEGATVALSCAANGRVVSALNTNDAISWAAGVGGTGTLFVLHRWSDSSGIWLSFRSADNPALTLCVDADGVLRARTVSATDTAVPGIWFSLQGDTLFSKGAGQFLNLFPAPQVGRIALIATNGSYVCAEGGGGSYLIANRPDLGEWETFNLIPVGSGFALQASNGKYVCAVAGGGGSVVVDRPGIGPWETFQIVDLGNDNIALSTARPFFLCAESGGAARLVADRDTIRSWETFRRVNLTQSRDQLRSDPSGGHTALTISTASHAVSIASSDAVQAAVLPAPAVVQLDAANVAKSDITASAAVRQKDAAVTAASEAATTAQQAAVSTLAGVLQGREQAAAAADAQLAMARVMAAALRSTSARLDGTGCIEVPRTRSLTVTDGDVVAVTLATTLPLGPAGTFEAWIKRSDLSRMTLLCIGDDASAPQCVVRVGTGLAFYNGQHWLPESGGLQADRWQHVAVTYDGRQVVYYIDGQNVATLDAGTAFAPSADPLRIGQRGALPAADNYRGLIDEVRMWRVARSPGELRGNMYRTLAGTTADLLACFRLDESGGTWALEQTPAGNHGTLRGGATLGVEGAPPAPTQIDGGLALANLRYVEIGNPDLVPGIALTFEARVHLVDLQDDIASLLNKWGDDANDEYLFGIQRDGRLTLLWQDAGGRHRAISERAVSIGKPMHVAVTRGGPTITFYIDGQLAGRGDVANLLRLRHGPTPLRIGAQLRGAHRKLNGALSEVRIWSIERTAADVDAARETPLTGRESGLAAYYRFDEHDGVTAFDQTTAGNHGRVRAALAMTARSLYQVNPAGELVLYHHTAEGAFDVVGQRIGSGWGGAARILAARDGHIYLIHTDGTLQYFHHMPDGSFNVQAVALGTGWNAFVWVGVAGFGSFYAVTSAGDLLYYAHDEALGWFIQGRKIGSGWNGFARLFTGGKGCLYAVTFDGTLLQYLHDEHFDWYRQGMSLGGGWDNYASLQSGGNGEIYAVKRSGDLCYHQHDQNVWTEGSGQTISSGWQVFDAHTPLPSLATDTALIGVQPTAVPSKTTAIGVPSLPSTALLFATARGDSAYGDTFAVSTLASGAAEFSLNCTRVDAGSVAGGWGQALQVGWLGFSPTTRAHLQCGTLHVGSSDGARRTVTGSFGQPFAVPPRVILTARGQRGGDTFALSTNGVSESGFSARLLRVDVADGWSQDVSVDWLAFDSLGDLASIETASGTASVGDRPTDSVNGKTLTVAFSQPLSRVPVVLVTPRGAEFDDAFAATVTQVTTEGFQVNVVRVDTFVTWGQVLLLDWLAVVPPVPGVGGSLASNFLVQCG